jgi:hypothetical protein
MIFYHNIFGYIEFNLLRLRIIKIIGEVNQACSSQDLIICNCLKKWSNSNKMTCIHGLDTNVVNYVISMG